jgi:hypothetical protein
MSGLWNDIVRLIGVLLIIFLFFKMFASPEQFNTLISESMIVLAATAIALILIIREYKKSETEW